MDKYWFLDESILVKRMALAMCFSSLLLLVVGYLAVIYRQRRNFWYHGVRLPSRPQQPFWYYVTVSVGCRPWAGHEGDIYLRLIGSQSESHTFLVNGETRSRLHEAESHVSIVSCARGLGEVNYVTMVCGATSRRKRWFLSSVHVAYLSDGTEQGKHWYFPYHEWIEVFLEPVKVTLSGVDIYHDINKRLILGWLARGITDFHSWTSIFCPLKYTTFRRSERMLCGGVHLVSLPTACIYLNTWIPHLGPVVLGVFAAAASATPIYLSEWIFRMTKRRPLIVVEDLSWYAANAKPYRDSYDIEDLNSLTAREVFCPREYAGRVQFLGICGTSKNIGDAERLNEIEKYEGLLKYDVMFLKWLADASSKPITFSPSAPSSYAPPVPNPFFNPLSGPTSFDSSRPTSDRTSFFASNRTSLPATYDPGSGFVSSGDSSRPKSASTQRQSEEEVKSDTAGELSSSFYRMTPSISSGTSNRASEKLSTPLHSQSVPTVSFKLSTNSERRSSANGEAGNVIDLHQKSFEAEPKALWRVDSNYSITSMDMEGVDFRNFEVLVTMPVDEFDQLRPGKQSLLTWGIESETGKGEHIYRRLVDSVSEVKLPQFAEKLNFAEDQLICMMCYDHCMNGRQWLKPDVPLEVIALNSGIRSDSDWIKLAFQTPEYKEDNRRRKLKAYHLERKHPAPIPNERVFSMLMFERFAKMLSNAFTQMTANASMRRCVNDVFASFTESTETCVIFCDACLEVAGAAEGRQALCSVFFGSSETKEWKELIKSLARRLQLFEEVTQMENGLDVNKDMQPREIELRFSKTAQSITSSKSTLVIWKNKLNGLNLPDLTNPATKLKDNKLALLASLFRAMVSERPSGCALFVQLLLQVSTEDEGIDVLSRFLRSVTIESNGIQRLASLHQAIGQSGPVGRRLLLRLYSAVKRQSRHCSQVLNQISNDMSEVPTGKLLLADVQIEGKRGHVAALRMKRYIHQSLHKYIKSAAQSLRHVIVNMDFISRCILTIADHSQEMLESRDFSLEEAIEKSLSENLQQAKSASTLGTGTSGGMYNTCDSCNCPLGASTSTEYVPSCCSHCDCDDRSLLSDLFSFIPGISAGRDRSHGNIARNGGNRGEQEKKVEGEKQAKRARGQEEKEEKKGKNHNSCALKTPPRQREKGQGECLLCNGRGKKEEGFTGVNNFNKHFFRKSDQEKFFMNFNTRSKCRICKHKALQEARNAAVTALKKALQNETCRNCEMKLGRTASRWGRQVVGRRDSAQTKWSARDIDLHRNCAICSLAEDLCEAGDSSEVLKAVNSGKSRAFQPIDVDHLATTVWSEFGLDSVDRSQKAGEENAFFMCNDALPVSSFPNKASRVESCDPGKSSSTSSEEERFVTPTSSPRGIKGTQPVEDAITAFRSRYQLHMHHCRPITAKDLRQMRKETTAPPAEHSNESEDTSVYFSVQESPSCAGGKSSSAGGKGSMSNASKANKATSQEKCGHDGNVEYCEGLEDSESIKLVKDPSYSHQFICNRKKVDPEKAPDVLLGTNEGCEKLVECVHLREENSSCLFPNKSNVGESTSEETCCDPRTRIAHVCPDNFQSPPISGRPPRDVNRDSNSTDYCSQNLSAPASRKTLSKSQSTVNEPRFASAKSLLPLKSASSYLQALQKFGEKALHINSETSSVVSDSGVSLVDEEMRSDYASSIAEPQQNALMNLLGLLLPGKQKYTKKKKRLNPKSPVTSTYLSFGSTGSKSRTSSKRAVKKWIDSSKAFNVKKSKWRQESGALRLVGNCVDMLVRLRVLIAQRREDATTKHEKSCEACNPRNASSYHVDLKLDRYSDDGHAGDVTLGVRYSEMLPQTWQDDIREGGSRDDQALQIPRFYRELVQTTARSAKAVLLEDDGEKFKSASKIRTNLISPLLGESDRNWLDLTEPASDETIFHLKNLSHFRSVIVSMMKVVEQGESIRRSKLLTNEDLSVAANLDVGEDAFRQSLENCAAYQRICKSSRDKTRLSKRTIFHSLNDYVRGRMCGKEEVCGEFLKQPWELESGQQAKAKEFLLQITDRLKEIGSDDKPKTAPLEDALDCMIESFLFRIAYKAIAQTSIQKAMKQATDMKQYLSYLEITARLCLAKILSFTEMVDLALRNTRGVFKKSMEGKSRENLFTEEWWHRAESGTDQSGRLNNRSQDPSGKDFLTMDDALTEFERLRRHVRYDMCLANFEILSMESLADEEALSIFPGDGEDPADQDNFEDDLAGKPSLIERFSVFKKQAPDVSSRPPSVTSTDCCVVSAAASATSNENNASNVKKSASNQQSSEPQNEITSATMENRIDDTTKPNAGEKSKAVTDDPCNQGVNLELPAPKSETGRSESMSSLLNRSCSSLSTSKAETAGKVGESPDHKVESSTVKIKSNFSYEAVGDSSDEEDGGRCVDLVVETSALSSESEEILVDTVLINDEGTITIPDGTTRKSPPFPSSPGSHFNDRSYVPYSSGYGSALSEFEARNARLGARDWDSNSLNTCASSDDHAYTTCQSQTDTSSCSEMFEEGGNREKSANNSSSDSCIITVTEACNFDLTSSASSHSVRFERESSDCAIAVDDFGCTLAPSAGYNIHEKVDLKELIPSSGSMPNNEERFTNIFNQPSLNEEATRGRTKKGLQSAKGKNMLEEIFHQNERDVPIEEIRAQPVMQQRAPLPPPSVDVPSLAPRPTDLEAFRNNVLALVSLQSGQLFPTFISSLFKIFLWLIAIAATALTYEQVYVRGYDDSVVVWSIPIAIFCFGFILEPLKCVFIAWILFLARRIPAFHNSPLFIKSDPSVIRRSSQLQPRTIGLLRRDFGSPNPSTARDYEIELYHKYVENKSRLNARRQQRRILPAATQSHVALDLDRCVTFAEAAMVEGSGDRFDPIITPATTSTLEGAYQASNDSDDSDEVFCIADGTKLSPVVAFKSDRSLPLRSAMKPKKKVRYMDNFTV